MIPITTSIKRCPNGKDLINGMTIPIKYIGGGAYILRKPKKQPTLGQGSYMATLEILGEKLGFSADLIPAKSVAMYMRNVSIHLQ